MENPGAEMKCCSHRTRQSGARPFLGWWTKQDAGLLIIALLALIWIVHRAAVQSITLDEANTYRLWVKPESPSHWEPHSNNHVLNSALMRVSIWMFGLTHVSVRLPALCGGAIYIYASYLLCLLLTRRRLLRWPLFLCVVYNPFVLDYLVAARGYGLALGFLGLAIYFFARLVLVGGNRDGEDQAVKDLSRISLCLALSICASFTFAYANAFLLLIATAVAGRSFWRRGGAFQAVHILGASIVPASLTMLVCVGSTLARFPKSQLFWGAKSLLETWRDIREASFYELNPNLINPLLASVLHVLERRVFQALAIFTIVCAIEVFVYRKDVLRSGQLRRLVLIGSLASVLFFAGLAHWVQFKLFSVPLPLERTSLWFIPLATVLIGVTVSIEPWNRLSRFRQGLGTVILCFVSFYFVGELRDAYFREWRIGADVRTAFPIIVDLCRQRGVREFISDQNLASSFNFYREVYDVRDIEKVLDYDELPAGKSIYVAVESYSGDVAQRERLRLVWRGSVSGLLVLVRPAEDDGKEKGGK